MEQQSPVVAITNLNVTLAMPEPAVNPAAAALFGALLNGGERKFSASNERPKLTPPAIGEYWPGQGGIYGGLRFYPEGMCHLIFAAQDVGKHVYGEYGTEVEANSQIDGRANTLVLLAREGKHPAAIAAAGYTADGHNDFYLPAISELYHGYTYLPEAFEKAWHVSSSQFSAFIAYLLDFEVGWLHRNDKDGERLVRPVRRILQ